MCCCSCVAVLVLLFLCCCFCVAVLVLLFLCCCSCVVVACVVADGAAFPVLGAQTNVQLRNEPLVEEHPRNKSTTPQQRFVMDMAKSVVLLQPGVIVATSRMYHMYGHHIEQYQTRRRANKQRFNAIDRKIREGTWVRVDAVSSPFSHLFLTFF